MQLSNSARFFLDQILFSVIFVNTFYLIVWQKQGIECISKPQEYCCIVGNHFNKENSISVYLMVKHKMWFDIFSDVNWLNSRS